MKMGTWLPEKRAKYNAKRRQKDLDFVLYTWNLPKEMTDATIHISEVPAKVAKKYKRAIDTHWQDWRSKNIDYCDKATKLQQLLPKDGGPVGNRGVDITRLITHHTTTTLAHMRTVLPKYQSKTIIDIPKDFRKFSTELMDRDISGSKGSAAVYQYWNHERLAVNHTSYTKKDELCLQHANEALSLLPQLQRNEIPHFEELHARIMRATAMLCMKDYKSTLLEYRVVLASIRLLDDAGRINMSDPNNSIMEKVNIWPHTMIRMTIKLKMQNGIQRPYFTKEEHLDLMKELAYGIYSPSSQKCTCCGKTENLSLCSGCKDAWFCDKACAAKCWKAGHKDKCGTMKYSGDKLGQVQEGAVPFAIPAPFLTNILAELDEDTEKGKDSMGIPMLNVTDRNFLVFARDPTSGEVFEVFSDQVFDLMVGRTITRGSQFGGTMCFHCLPDDPRAPSFSTSNCLD